MTQPTHTHNRDEEPTFKIQVPFRQGNACEQCNKTMSIAVDASITRIASGAQAVFTARAECVWRPRKLVFESKDLGNAVLRELKIGCVSQLVSAYGNIPLSAFTRDSFAQFRGDIVQISQQVTVEIINTADHAIDVQGWTLGERWADESGAAPPAPVIVQPSPSNYAPIGVPVGGTVDGSPFLHSQGPLYAVKEFPGDSGHIWVEPVGDAPPLTEDQNKDLIKTVTAHRPSAFHLRESMLGLEPFVIVTCSECHQRVQRPATRPIVLYSGTHGMFVSDWVQDTFAPKEIHFTSTMPNTIVARSLRCGSREMLTRPIPVAQLSDLETVVKGRDTKGTLQISQSMALEIENQGKSSVICEPYVLGVTVRW
jgi:hypothetical protein